MKRGDEKNGGCVVAAAIFALVFVAGMVCGSLLARAEGYIPTCAECDSTYTAPMREEATTETGKILDDWESVTATAYCPCRACCGEWADKLSGALAKLVGTMRADTCGTGRSS